MHQQHALPAFRLKRQVLSEPTLFEDQIVGGEVVVFVGVRDEVVTAPVEAVADGSEDLLVVDRTRRAPAG